MIIDIPRTTIPHIQLIGVFSVDDVVSGFVCFINKIRLTVVYVNALDKPCACAIGIELDPGAAVINDKFIRACLEVCLARNFGSGASVCDCIYGCHDVM